MTSWGGSRVSAGRPPLDDVPRDKIAFSLPAKLVERIKRRAQARRMSRSETVAKLLERGLACRCQPDD